MADEVDIRFGAAHADLTRAIDELKNKLETLGSPVKELASQFGELGEVIVASFGVEKLAELGEKVMEFAERMSELGERVADTAQILGMGAEEFQRLSYAATATGLSGDAMAHGLERLERNISEAAAGGATATAVFKALGISVIDAEGHVKSGIQVIYEMAARFREVADGPEKVAAAMGAMGRSGAELIPFFNKGVAGLEELGLAADRTGSILSSEAAEGMEKTHQKIVELDAAFTGARETIFNALKPAIDALIESLTTLVEWANRVGETWLASENPSLLNDAALGRAIDSIDGKIKEQEATLEELRRKGSDPFMAGLQQDNAAIEDVTASLEQLKARREDMLGIREHRAEESHENQEKPHLAPLDTSGAGSGPGQVEVWRNELQSQLIAEQSYFADSKREEIAFWQAKVDETEAGSKERLQVESQIYVLSRALAQQDLQDQLATIRAKQEAAKFDYATRLDLENQKLALLAKDYGEDSRQYQAALREKETMEREHLAELARMQLEADDTARKIRQTGIEAEKEDLETSVQLGEISNAEKLASLKALADESYRLSQQALQEQATLPGQSPEQVQKIYDQIEILTAQHTAEMAKLNRQAALDAKAAWQDFTAPFESAFDGTIQGIYQGTLTWQQAERNIFQNILISWTETLGAMAAKWVAFQAATTFGWNQIAGAIGNPMKSGIGALIGGSVGGATDSGSSNTAAIAALTTALTGQTAATTANTVTTDSNTSTGLLPSIAQMLGLASVETADTAVTSGGLIPAIAALTTAVTANTSALTANSFGGGGFLADLIPGFAVGAWDLPGDTLARVHAGEMIVPSSPAEALRGVFSGLSGTSFPRLGLSSDISRPANANLAQAASAGAAGVAAGGDHYTVTIQAVDARSLTNLLQRNPQAVTSVMARARANNASLTKVAS